MKDMRTVPWDPTPEQISAAAKVDVISRVNEDGSRAYIRLNHHEIKQVYKSMLEAADPLKNDV